MSFEGLNADRPATATRRDAQRAALIVCAERAITAGGLPALKARDLAGCVGCSLGAIYNLVHDLDEVVLRVGQRTMAELEHHLPAGNEAASLAEQLVAFARAYCAFAASNTHRWRALFEFKIAAGTQLPPWFVDDRARVFARLERPIATALPRLPAEAVARQARILFSAVHGLVLLGLEEKLADHERPEDRRDELDAEIVAFLDIYAAGLVAASSA